MRKGFLPHLNRLSVFPLVWRTDLMQMAIAAASFSLKDGFLRLLRRRTVLRTFLIQWQRDVASDFILF